MNQVTRTAAHKIRAANPDDPPQYLGPRRPGALTACLVDGMHVVSYKVHRETGFHKRAVARERAAARSLRRELEAGRLSARKQRRHLKDLLDAAGGS